MKAFLPFDSLPYGNVVGYLESRLKLAKNLLRHAHWEDIDWPYAREDDFSANLSWQLVSSSKGESIDDSLLKIDNSLDVYSRPDEWDSSSPDSMRVDTECSLVASLLSDILLPTSDKWKLIIYSLTPKHKIDRFIKMK